MKKPYLLLAFLCLLNSLAFSQIGILNDSPENINLEFPQTNLVSGTPVFATTLAEALDQTFDSISTASTITGFNAAMLLPDGSLWKRASGLAEVDPDTVALTTDHLMAMGSISKSFVSATILLLFEDGLLSLDDSIGQYLAPYPNVPPEATIKQLLSHRTGINDYLNENPATINAWGNNLDSLWNADTLLNNYVLAPNFAPGASWSYSNTNYLLAGKIIENITGQPWYEVVRERIIDPMNLTHTYVYPWESPGNELVSHAWSDLTGTGVIGDVQAAGLFLEGLYSMAGSAGCLLSSPEDLVAFSDQLYGGGFLQAATLAEMQTDYIQNPATGAEYGLGALSFLFGAELENWGHNGSLIYQSVALHFSEKNISIAVQQNDVRLSQPGAPTIDVNEMMLALVDACQNYSPPVSTLSVDKEKGFSLSPNPTNGVLYIYIENDNAFPIIGELLGMNGQRIRRFNLAQKKSNIHIEDLPNGMYLLKIGNDYEKIILSK